MALTQITTNGIKDGTITGTDLTTNVDLVDNQKIRLGTGNDLEIFHNGTNSFIQNNTGNLYLRGTSSIILENTNNEDYIVAAPNGSVDLYYDNVKKFETTSTGATVTGTLTATGFATNGGGVTLNGANYNAAWVRSANTMRFNDNAIAGFGNADDLKIYHNGSDSYVQDNGTGKLVLSTNGTRIDFYDSANSATLAKFITGGGVELYYDNDKVLNTISNGIQIDDNTKIFENAAHNTAVIQHADIHHAIILRGSTNADGSTITNDNKTTFREYGDFIFRTGQINALERLIIESNGTSRFVNNNDSTNEEIAKFNPNGSVELYYDNSKKFETTSSGVSITGGITTSGASTINEDFTFVAANGEDLRFDKSDSALEFNDNFKCVFGNSSDLSIYHDGSHTYIDNVTGNLNIRGANNENAILYTANGSIQLFHDNSKKFETQSIGITVTGQVACDELDMADSTGAGNNRIKLGTGDDLQIYHDGGGSYIANSTGILRLQAKSGENSISLNPDGSVELYYDHSKKFQTNSGGADVTGDFGISGELNLMQGSTNSNRFIDASLADGEALFIRATQGGDANHENMALFHRNGDVELYYDNVKRFETTAAGASVNGVFYIGPPAGADKDLVINKEGTGTLVRFRTTGTTRGTITSNGSTVAYNTSASDRSMKKNFEDWTEDTLALFKNINPQKFNFLDQEDETKKEKGFIAQDLVASFPEAYQKNDDDKYMFNASGMVVYLMKAIQELEAEVAALKAA